MSSHFLIRPTAEADLTSIEEYLAEHTSGEVAVSFLEAAADIFRLLASQPEMGRRWDSALPHLHAVRAWPLQLHRGCLILYRPLAPEPGIEVLYVFQGSRAIQALLDEREEPEGATRSPTPSPGPRRSTTQRRSPGQASTASRSSSPRPANTAPGASSSSSPPTSGTRTPGGPTSTP